MEVLDHPGGPSIIKSPDEGKREVMGQQRSMMQWLVLER